MPNAQFPRTTVFGPENASMRTAVTSCWPPDARWSSRLPATMSTSSIVPKPMLRGSSTRSMKARQFWPGFPLVFGDLVDAEILVLESVAGDVAIALHQARDHLDEAGLAGARIAVADEGEEEAAELHEGVLARFEIVARQHAREPHRLRLRDVVADDLVRRLELHVDARLAPAAGPVEAVDVEAVRLDRVGRVGEVGEHLAHRGWRRLLGPLHHIDAGARDRAVEILGRDAPDRIDQSVHQPGERVGGVGERDVAGRARLARGRRRLHRRHVGGGREGRDQRLGAHEHAEAVEVGAVQRALAVALAEIEVAERLDEQLAHRHAHRKRAPRLEEDGVALRRKQRVAVLAQDRFEVDPRALLPGRAGGGRDGADEAGERGGLSVRGAAPPPAPRRSGSAKAPRHRSRGCDLRARGLSGRPSRSSGVLDQAVVGREHVDACGAQRRVFATALGDPLEHAMRHGHVMAELGHAALRAVGVVQRDVKGLLRPGGGEESAADHLRAGRDERVDGPADRPCLLQVVRLPHDVHQRILRLGEDVGDERSDGDLGEPLQPQILHRPVDLVGQRERGEALAGEAVCDGRDSGRLGECRRPAELCRDLEMSIGADGAARRAVPEVPRGMHFGRLVRPWALEGRLRANDARP